MNIVLDSGAIIAFERGDKVFTAIVRASRRDRVAIAVPSAVLAETWREASTHPRTSLLIKSVDDIPSLDFERARRVGAILARSETSAVVDGSVVEVALARLPSMIVTSDPEDISRLLQSEDVAFARFGAAGSKQADVIVLTI